MTCCVFCVNMIKIKKAAQALRKALPLNALILPFPVKSYEMFKSLERRKVVHINLSKQIKFLSS